MSPETATRGLASTLELMEKVEGWLSGSQAKRLWEAASRVPQSGTIVEIGSFRGRSTIVLASAARHGVEVVAVDPHAGGDRGPNEIAPVPGRGEEDFRAFHANLGRAGVEGVVRHIRRVSQDSLGEVEGSIDLLYVDGAHRYRPTRADIERWGARVRPGGSMLVHDSFNAVGVTLAQLRLLFLSGEWRYLGRVRSLSEYRREGLSRLERARNFLRQAAVLPHFVRNVLIKVALVTKMRPVARLLGHGGGDWPY